MARIVENAKGFKVIEVTRIDCYYWGGLGICDWCNAVVNKGYFVAVLNSVMCEDCYNKWCESAERFPEDNEIERKIFMKMKALLNL